MKRQDGSVTTKILNPRELCQDYLQEDIEEKLKLQIDLLASVNECIVAVDANYDVIFWNEAAHKLLGWGESDIIGKSITEILKGNHWQLIKDKVLAGEKSFQGRLDNIILYDGQAKTIKFSVNIVKENDNKIKHIVAVATDITDLVTSHNKAIEDNLAKSRFLATISHEIRTPLAGILGYCEILNQQGASEQQKESIETIQYCSTQLLELVNNLLDLSRIEAGQVEIDNEVFNLRNMIHKTVYSIQPNIKDKGLHLVLVMEDDIPEYVRGDELRIRQVLSNLLVNAAKYTAEGGIRVTALRPKDSGFYEQESIFPLQISVVDTGNGITASQIDRIFEPFIQGETTSGGAGLGLAISKQLVEAMGGHLWYEPNQYGGSIFSFTLFLQKTEKSLIKADNNEYPAIGQDQEAVDFPYTILLVEDMKINRKLLKFMLQGIGYNVITARNGEECLQLLKTVRPDVILMDMQMPIMDGYTATTIIRTSSQWEDIPVIALTAHAMKTDIDKCIKAGCNYYLSKPFTQEQLAEIVSLSLRAASALENKNSG